MLVVGKQKLILTAPALANKIITVISFYTQKHKVGFLVLACDVGKSVYKLGLVNILR